MASSGDTSQIKYATATSTSDGDYASPLVAAVAGKKIRVIALSASVLTTAGVFSLKGSSTIFQAHLALGTPWAFATNSPKIGLCETDTGAALTPNNGSGVDSFVNVSYVEVEP